MKSNSSRTSIPETMENTAAAFTGIFGIIFVIFLMVLGLMWMVLPFIIYSKLSKIEQHLAKANQNNDVRHIYTAALMEDIKGNTKQTADTLSGAHIER